MNSILRLRQGPAEAATGHAAPVQAGGGGGGGRGGAVADVSHGFGYPMGLGSKWSGTNCVLNLALIIRAVTLSRFKDQVKDEKGQK